MKSSSLVPWSVQPKHGLGKKWVKEQIAVVAHRATARHGWSKEYPISILPGRKGRFVIREFYHCFFADGTCHTSKNNDHYPLVIKHSYWTWPFIVGFPIKHDVFPQLCSSLPEGIVILTQGWKKNRVDHQRPSCSCLRKNLGLAVQIWKKPM